jgi:hypothetical protein
MSYIKTTISLLFALACLGLLSVGGYYVIKFAVDVLARLDSQIAATLVVASAITLLVALIIARSIRQAGKQNQTNLLPTQKVTTYQLFADLWEGLLRPERGRDDGNSSKLSEDLRALECLLSLYSSPGVIKAYMELRASMRDSGAQDLAVQVQFARVLREIRKDLGMDTHHLGVEELQELLYGEFSIVSVSASTRAYPDLKPRASLASKS